MRKTKKVLLVLACLMLAFIWGHSLMSVEQSGAESLRVVELLKSLVSRVCGLLGIGGAVEVVWITDHLVRKTAHFVEFAVLGGLFGLVTGAGAKTGEPDAGSERCGESDAGSERCGVRGGGAVRDESERCGVRGGGAVRVICACLLGLLAAFLDETLQIFSGRGSMVADVWLDFAGGVFGVAVITLGRWIAGQRKDVYRRKADREGG